MDRASLNIFANWKAFLGKKEVVEWLNYFNKHYQPHDNVQVFLGPSFTNISYVIEHCSHDDVMVYAQDVSHLKAGAHTGEVTVEDLLSHMVDGVLIGHSERRSQLEESNERINKKLDCISSADVMVVIAISQIEQLQSVIDAGNKPTDFIWAYEPIEAIGSGNPATVERVESFVKDMYDVAGNDITVIYGGSVDSKNIGQYISIPEIQGALIATASKDPEEFIRIIDVAATY